MSRDLKDLSQRLKPLALQLLTKLADEGIDVVVIYTGRTPEEQADCVKRGVSWTMKSKHLTGDAIDLAPRCLLSEKNWAPYSPLWECLGAMGESLGLTWGGRWKGKKCDRPHFEIKA